MQALQQLNADYQAMNKSTQTFINVSDANRTITLQDLQLVSVAALKGFYLRQSLKFELLLDVFLEDVHSNETIAFRHSSSTTVVRMTKEEMREQLQQYHIDISDDYQLVGDEQRIRTLMIELIYLVYANQSLPFATDTKRYTAQVQHELVPLLTTRVTIKRILEIAIGVWYTRFTTGHQIPSTEDKLLKPTEELHPAAQELVTQFGTYLKVRSKIGKAWLDTELRYGVAVCYALGIGKTTDYLSDLTTDNQVKMNLVIDQVIASYQNYFGQEMLPQKKQELMTLIGPLLIRLQYFPPYDMGTICDVDFQSRAYPIHTAFTKQIIHELVSLFQYDEDHMVAMTFSPLLNAFIKVLPVSDILPVITITIDLIDMPALEDYLKQMVMQWHALNVVITHEFTDQTDIYLSNVMLSQDVPGFAWHAIPEWSERLALRQLIVDLTLKRFNEI